MKYRLYALISLLIVVSLLLGACTLALDKKSTPQVDGNALSPATINIAAQIGLEETTAIDVYELLDDPVAMQVYLGTISERAVIDELVAALDAAVPLAEAPSCAARYRLRFQQADGSTQTFTYACQLATPSFLHGEGPAWQDRVAVVPDRFNDVMAQQLLAMTDLASASLSPATEHDIAHERILHP